MLNIGQRSRQVLRDVGRDNSLRLLQLAFFCLLNYLLDENISRDFAIYDKIRSDKKCDYRNCPVLFIDHNHIREAWQKYNRSSSIYFPGFLHLKCITHITSIDYVSSNGPSRFNKLVNRLYRIKVKLPEILSNSSVGNETPCRAAGVRDSARVRVRKID